MKKLGLVLFIAVLTMSTVLAQPGDPAARLQRELDGLTTEFKFVERSGCESNSNSN